jgi:hypothetical protein
MSALQRRMVAAPGRPGDVFLSDGFEANEGGRLAGAEISGDLTCGSAKLRNERGDALAADRIKVNAGVFLTNLDVIGRTRLGWAIITSREPDRGCRPVGLLVGSSGGAHGPISRGPTRPHPLQQRRRVPQATPRPEPIRRAG